MKPHIILVALAAAGSVSASDYRPMAAMLSNNTSPFPEDKAVPQNQGLQPQDQYRTPIHRFRGTSHNK